MKSTDPTCDPFNSQQSRENNWFSPDMISIDDLCHLSWKTYNQKGSHWIAQNKFQDIPRPESIFQDPVIVPSNV